jgi:hypothetical protein
MRSLLVVATKETATTAEAVATAAAVDTMATAIVVGHLDPGRILVPGHSPDRNQREDFFCYKKGWSFPILFIVTKAWKSSKYLKTLK